MYALVYTNAFIFVSIVTSEPVQVETALYNYYISCSNTHIFPAEKIKLKNFLTIKIYR